MDQTEIHSVIAPLKNATITLSDYEPVSHWYGKNEEKERTEDITETYNYLENHHLLVGLESLSTKKYPVNEKDYRIPHNNTLWINKSTCEIVTYNYYKGCKDDLDPRIAFSRLETLLEIKKTFDDYQNEGNWFCNALLLKSPKQMDLSRTFQNLLNYLPCLPD
jgi:hypothetical protein